MADENVTTQQGAAATTAPEVKPSEVVADAASKVAAESKEEATLLGTEETVSEKEGGAPPPVAPEKYEIKAPEGMTVDSAMLDKLTPVFKELGMSQEAVQRLADAYAPHINQMIENQRQSAVNEFQKMVGEWKDQTVKALGPEYQKELGVAAKFIDKFGGVELRQVLNDTGLGNHPVVVKAFIAAGKAIANDTFPDSGKKGTSLESPEAKAAVLFPSHKQS